MKPLFDLRTVRLDLIASQIAALQSRLKGLGIDGRLGSIGPVEAAILNIELAELQMEHKALVSRLPL